MCVCIGYLMQEQNTYLSICEEKMEIKFEKKYDFLSSMFERNVHRLNSRKSHLYQNSPIRYTNIDQYTHRFSAGLE